MHSDVRMNCYSSTGGMGSETGILGGDLATTLGLFRTARMLKNVGSRIIWASGRTAAGGGKISLFLGNNMVY